MKTIFNLFLLFSIVNIVYSQEQFYYYKNNRIPLEVSTKKIIIKFSDSLTFKQKKQIIESNFSLMSIQKQINDSISGIIIVNIIKEITFFNIKEIITQLNKNKDIIYANPVYVCKDSLKQGLTGEFIVKLKFPANYSELQRIAKETKTKIVKQYQYDTSIYILETDKNSNGNALEMANYFYETKNFEFAEPNFLGIDIISSNDPYFSDQWSLQNTGQYSGIPGADMNVPNAWSITMGSSDITVAVVDDGVDLVHPDLIDNILSGFDAAGEGTDGAPTGNDAHGTACAGIIAAKANNGIGIAGVCPNCKILPIRALPSGGCTATMLAEGIDWAWQNGADVISNSWHFSQSSLIDVAINNATTSGRNELGCVVLFAAGNEGSSVNYPASLPNVIAVGAMSMCNERKNSNSCDGEDWWGSNYGPELDVVAPGVKISTTDISGSAGYNNYNFWEMYNNDYVKNFNGTSSATPNAAGVCALILSINPCLTYSQVAQILELSCIKVGSYCYSKLPTYPNGTWNNEVGYGKVNAYNAVRLASNLQSYSNSNISGTDQGANDCNGNLCQWQLIGGGCSGLAASTYYIYWHEITSNVSFPNIPGMAITACSNGFSTNSPNSGNYFAGVSNVTSTSATLYTYVFETYDILGNFLGWVPTAPSNIRFNYQILSLINTDTYLQNQTISTGAQNYDAINNIETGNNVTTSLPTGNFVISGNANITLHGGNKVLLEPGTTVTPSLSGYFRAYACPYFTCTQYSKGKIIENYDNFQKVIDDYSITKSTELTSEGKSLSNYPNPFVKSTTIEYQIPTESKSVIISISNLNGEEISVFKSKDKQAAGKYQIKLDGINLPAGIYIYKIESDNYNDSKKMVKLE